MAITKKNFSISCLTIPEHQNYWFVRTQDGTLFDKFISSRFIAIGWNEININRIKNTKSKDELQKYITETFPKQRRHGLTATHMIRFVTEMKIGDIVVIPSKSSQKFSFGKIISDAFESTEIDDSDCDLNKRRKIHWIKTVDSSDLENALQAIKYSEAAVNNANSYSHLIDRALGGFMYQKGATTSLVIEAGEDGNIKLRDLNNFLTAALNLIEKAHPEIDIDTIGIKLNLQSRGKLELLCGSAIVIFTIGAAIFACTKNDLSINVNIMGTTIETNAKGPTLLESYSNFQDKELEREIKRFHLEQEKMKVAIPQKKEQPQTENSKLSKEFTN